MISDSDLEIVERIRQIRAKNNDPWMQIVLIALRHDPISTRAVLKEILWNDRDVCNQVERLVE